MPLIAVALCAIFHLSGPLAVGVILVGCCPSSTSSNVMSYLSRGDAGPVLHRHPLHPVPVHDSAADAAARFSVRVVPTPVLFLNAVKVVLFDRPRCDLPHDLRQEDQKVTVALPIVSQVAILLIIGVVVAANGPKLFVAFSWWPSRWSSCTTCAATRWASASPS